MESYRRDWTNGSLYWDTITRRVYVHDGCDTAHYTLRTAQNCEAKIQRRNHPRLFR